MKKLLVLFTVLWVSQITPAQNPFAAYGYEVKTATMSNGKYDENHDMTDVVEIGSFRFDTRKNEIVGIIERDATKQYLAPEVVSRFVSMDPHAERYYSISPYAYCANNPIKFTDPTGKWIVGTDGKRVTYNAETGWSKNASTDTQRVGNAMLKTDTGTGQLNYLLDHSDKISVAISSETIKSSDGKLTMGINNRTNMKEDKDGIIKVEEHKIKIYEGSVKEAIKTIGGVKEYAGLNLEDAIGAVAGHESGHTEIENTRQAWDNSEKGSKHDVEKRPNEIENKILEELKNKKGM